MYVHTLLRTGYFYACTDYLYEYAVEYIGFLSKINGWLKFSYR